MKETVGPLELLETRVLPEWLDYNAHMNAGYYAVVYNLAIEKYLEIVGLGEDLVKEGVGTTFALECHLTYQRELREADPIMVTAQLLDYDEKKIHIFLRMVHAEENFLASTYEQISVYVDLETRRSAPMPPFALDKLEHLYNAHKRLPKPAEVGRTIRLRSH